MVILLYGTVFMCFVSLLIKVLQDRLLCRIIFDIRRKGGHCRTLLWLQKKKVICVVSWKDISKVILGIIRS